ncbi:cathepsin B-like cysteine proteinase 5 [Paramacrobiotus metropolitanus]|uniref:cathepsin B-like cysteine proteinase 5 n=1 Tax=Paramacrobiotus metropolitanus TaxID=2943436 RepID=UPI0024460D36|nr:cathepsin B-like cysteine proteinase 5 [Paramacrobiotus metropolitanus]
MTRVLVLLALVAVAGFVTFANAKPGKVITPRGGHVPLSKHEQKKQPKFQIHHKHRAPATLPKSFDARKKWPQCKSILDIRDQGQCGTCWAVSSASVLSDRLCIAELTAGKTPSQIYVSALDLATCKDLTRTPDENCEVGGATENAYKWATLTGYMTGGNLNSKVGCKPYPVGNDGPMPLSCSDSCTNSDYDKTPQDDTAYVDSYWTSYLGDNPTSAKIQDNVNKMQQDLYANGPITASIRIWSDWSGWKTSSGAYRGPSPTAKKQEGHAVRIIGWDVDANGIKYWLIANSWGVGDQWNSRGDKGVYWIEMGKNVVGIEGSPTAPVIVMPNNCGAFCSSPITQIVRMDSTDLNSNSYAFQGNCVTQVTVGGDGTITTTGSPQPISKLFVGGPAGPITSWMGGNGPSDPLWIINPSGEAGSCSPPASGSTKVSCTGGTATSGASAQTYVGSDKIVFYNDQKDWLFTFKSGSTSGSGAPIDDAISSKFSQVNALYNIDNSQVLICGLDTSGTSACATMQMSDNTVSDPKPLNSMVSNC